jgi:thiosulfate/3-mercaptopyruvate sulfurtransferase
MGCFAILLLMSTGVFGANVGVIEVQKFSRNPGAWVVLDGRPKAQWQAGHVPGAHSFSWENYTRTDEKGVQFKVLSPREMADALAALGIGEKTAVVVYGDADTSWGGEGWLVWVLSWLGHQGEVRILSGGIQSWRAANLSVEKGEVRYRGPRLRYQVALQPQLDISTGELRKVLGKVTLVDTRSTWERLRGTLPGAVAISWEDFFAGKDRHPLPPAEVKKLLAKHGVDLRKPVVYYCTGGIRSGYAWMVHTLAGLPNGRNYEGGMEEWKRLGSP